MSELEFRQTIGVFRNNREKQLCEIQSLAVKQSVDMFSVVDVTNPITTPTNNNNTAAPHPLVSSSPTPMPASTPPPNPTTATSTHQHQQRSASIASDISNNNNNENMTMTAIASSTKFIKQLCNILTSPPTAGKNNNKSTTSSTTTSTNVVVPDKILKAVPESEYLEAALTSVATCSSIVGQTLPELNLRPSSLTQDVTSICEIASRLFRSESRLKKVISNLEKELQQHQNQQPHETSSSFLSVSDHLASICQKLSVKHENEIQNLTSKLQSIERERDEALNRVAELEQEEKQKIMDLQDEVQKLRKENNDLLFSLNSRSNANTNTTTTTNRFPHDNLSSSPPQNTSSSSLSYPSAANYYPNSNNKSSPQKEDGATSVIIIEKLQAELRSKTNLVKHLMQLTNDNGKVIDEMRQHSIQRRDECIELRRRIREVEERHVFFIEASVKEIDNMLDTFQSPTSTSTSNLRSVVFMLNSLRQKLIT